MKNNERFEYVKLRIGSAYETLITYDRDSVKPLIKSCLEMIQQIELEVNKEL